MPEETDRLLEDAANRDDTLPHPPLRPVKEYEDIIIREVTLGFSCGVQDFTLYPEDVITIYEDGNIQIVFHTLGGGEFWAYANHIQFHSTREMPHRREKGTQRPDPKKMMEEMRNEELRRMTRRVQKEAEEGGS